MATHDDNHNHHFDTEYELDVIEQLDEPVLFNVIMHNDDYTSMDFVVAVLLDVFNYDIDRAVVTMLGVHHQGRAVVATIPKDIAEMKIAQVQKLADDAEYPFMLTLERA